MPKKVVRALTPLGVKNAKSGRHADGEGLYLLVKDTGAKSWVFRFTLRGKTRDVGLSTCPETVQLLRQAGGRELTLAQARDIAAIYRLKVKAGIDPLEERAQEVAARSADAQAMAIKAITFKAAAETYIEANEDSWRNPKHRQQWCTTLATYVYPVMGDIAVAEIETSHVLKVIEPLWKAKPETASRIRGRIEMVLDAAKARGQRSGENPARWRGHINHILPTRTKLSRGHHKAIPYTEVAAFLDVLRAKQTVAGLALEFAILTAARTGEVIGATWDEVDPSAEVWSVSAARMKAGREHRVPLSARAIEILAEVRKLGSPWLFPGARGGSLSSMAMAMLVRRIGTDVTVHGFRSAFRDWAAECTSYPQDVCEMALAHTVSNKVEAAYRRGDMFDKRRRLMDDWAGYCASQGFEGATITPIRSLR